MSTLVTVVLALSAAGGLAWLVRRYEASRMPRSTECSRAVDAVFAKGTNDTADSVLLKELLTHRDRCQSDVIFVDQARRLMTNLQQPAEARALLEFAESQHAMKPDEFIAQKAWIDVAESHQVWADGDETRAKELLDRANSAANKLREKWPEWSLPYRILEEAGRSGASATRYGEGTDFYQIERTIRNRKLNGAWIRSLSDWQPSAFTFVLAAIAFLACAAGFDGIIGAREMSGRKTSQIATAKPGYVELKGTLHPLSGAQLVIGPYTKTPAVWYELQTNSGGKKAITHYTRSSQLFLIRDATGDVIVDPTSISVRTRHTTTRFGNSIGQMTGARTTENLLNDGDPAFALGELSVTSDANGAQIKHLKVAKDGRRLFVSNYTEAQLITMEKLWFALGASICVVALLVLAWSYYQRYHVIVAPGILP